MINTQHTPHNTEIHTHKRTTESGQEPRIIIIEMEKARDEIVCGLFKHNNHSYSSRTYAGVACNLQLAVCILLPFTRVSDADDINNIDA